MSTRSQNPFIWDKNIYERVCIQTHTQIHTHTLPYPHLLDWTLWSILEAGEFGSRLHECFYVLLKEILKFQKKFPRSAASDLLGRKGRMVMRGLSRCQNKRVRGSAWFLAASLRSDQVVPSFHSRGQRKDVVGAQVPALYLGNRGISDPLGCGMVWSLSDERAVSLGCQWRW